MAEQKAIQGQCAIKALEAYGTGYIFEQRAARFRNRLRILAFLGIAVPASVGFIVLSINNLSALSVVVPIAVVLGFVELIFSIWSLAARWEDTYSYALESLASNYRLSNTYNTLVINPPADLPTFRLRYELIEKEDEFRQEADLKQGITDEERRMGMRAALRQFQRSCAHCGKTPVSMTSTDCPVCGDFKRRWL